MVLSKELTWQQLSNPFDLYGRLVVVTGGAGFLGRQWVNALKHAHASVYVIDQAHGTGTDVRDRAQLERELAHMRKCYSREEKPFHPIYLGRSTPVTAPDALICAAALDAKPGTGVGPLDALEDMPDGLWEKVVDVNLTGVLRSVQVFGGAMAAAGGGSIVLVSSMYALVGPDQRRYAGGFVKPAAYSATKAALIGLTRWLASYWGPNGVRVNAVCFGAMEHESHDEGFRASMEAAIPLGRLAWPHEWDGPILYLCSDASSYMTGSVLTVDGGYTAW